MRKIKWRALRWCLLIAVAATYSGGCFFDDRDHHHHDEWHDRDRW